MKKIKYLIITLITLIIPTIVNASIDPFTDTSYKCSGNNCPKCVRATKLHTATCQSRDGKGCKAAGYSEGDTITYGTFGSGEQLAPGNAFDCDVNGDGIYDSNKERFYYVSNAWRNGSFNSNIAVLVAANAYNGGTVDNSTTTAYNSEGLYKPDTLKSKLPTTSQWKNVSLSNTSRNIYNIDGTIQTENYDYSGYAARLLTYQEILNVNSSAETEASLDNNYWLLENTKFQNESLPFGYWLETVWIIPNSSIPMAAEIDGLFRNMYRILISYDPNNTVHPAIEVSYSDIQSTSPTGAIVDDETEDHVKRYTGANPNNYIKFNNELWRIIGKYGDNLKIIKATELDDSRKYDSTSSSNYYGDSELKQYLNGEYYNNLSLAAKEMIAEGTWNTGYGGEDASALQLYNASKEPLPGVNEQTTWTGKVGVIAAYEFRYAANPECWNISVNITAASCDNWMKASTSNTSRWTLTSTQTVGWMVVYQNNGRLSERAKTYFEYDVQPVVYLKSNVEIVSGAGSESDPYTIKLKSGSSTDDDSEQEGGSSKDNNNGDKQNNSGQSSKKQKKVDNPPTGIGLKFVSYIVSGLLFAGTIIFLNKRYNKLKKI